MVAPVRRQDKSAAACFSCQEAYEVKKNGCSSSFPPADHKMGHLRFPGIKDPCHKKSRQMPEKKVKRNSGFFFSQK
jgi:hypothetical protein